MSDNQSQNVFFADLHHPGGEHEDINRLISEIPSSAIRLFLLGDIFHYWVNEPGFIQEYYSPFLAKLRELSRQGLELYFLEGNRDFLASHYLLEQPWIDVLPNPYVTELGGRAVYLGHGDELCWNDWAYQAYKSVIRSNIVRNMADRLPAKMQRNMVKKMSEASGQIVSGKTQKTLAVPEKAYRQVAATGIDVIVHGHIHDSYQRAVESDGHRAEIFCFGWMNGKRNFIHFEG